MYHEFSDILARMGLWNDAGTVLLAVSGGMDSMCMADLFRRTGLQFAVAHCNFHLRGDESDGDEAMVREWAGKCGARFHKADFDTESFASENGASIEMAARELRYKWFARLCLENGYSALCVAHNANDNAETLFLNLVRGTGLRGLSGMGEESVAPYPAGEVQVRLLRPLLSFTRKQIEGYVRRYSIPYRDDSTNAGTEYKRNKIRHLVFPVLEQMNPSFISTVSEEMRHFAQAEAIADTYCKSVEDSIARKVGGDIVLDQSSLLNTAHWEYVLYNFLDRFGFHGSVSGAVASLLKSDRTVPGKKFTSAGFMLLTASGKLILRPLAEVHARSSIQSFSLSHDIFTVVRGDGGYRCNGVEFTVSTMPRSEIKSLKQPPGVLIFDASALKFPFVCRPWRDGDWFVPFGMKGRKKISDFFTDMKYDLFRKSGAVMVVDASDLNRDESRVAAVLGERIDDRCKVTPATSSVLMIKIGIPCGI